MPQDSEVERLRWEVETQRNTLQMALIICEQLLKLDARLRYSEATLLQVENVFRELRPCCESVVRQCEAHGGPVPR